MDFFDNCFWGGFRFVVLSALFLCVFDKPRAEKVAYTDSIAAVVGEEVITTFELLQYTHEAEMQIRKEFTDLSSAELKQKLVDLRKAAASELVERELMYAEFKANDWRVPPAMIQKRIDELVAARFGGDWESFEEELLDNHTTLAEYEDEVVRKAIAVELIQQQKVSRLVHVSPDLVDTYYQQHPEEFRVAPRIRMGIIFLKKDGRFAGRVDETVKEILKKIADGKDFSELAASYSEHSSSSEDGDLGWVERENANPLFLKAVEGVEPGRAGSPVRIDAGVFIVYLADVKDEGILPLDSRLKARIRRMLRIREESRRYEDFITELRSRYHVRTFF